MSQTTSAAGVRRPTLGRVAQVAGVLGAIACVLAIVVVLSGRTWIQQRVDVLQQGAAHELEQAMAAGGQAIEGLAAGAQQAAGIRTTAEGLAANPALDEIAITELQQRLAPLAERYGAVRDQYLSLRDTTTGLLDTLARLERIIPGLDIPDGPVELVGRIDEGLMGLDQAVTDLSAKAADRAGATDIANSIAADATRLEEGLTAASGLATDVRARVGELEAKVAGVSDHVGTLLTYGSIAVALLFVWVLVLNLALIALGRRWRAS